MEETFCDDILFKTSHSYINEESGAYFEINSTEKPAEAKIDADIKMVKVFNEDVVSPVLKPKPLIHTHCINQQVR